MSPDARYGEYGSETPLRGRDRYFDVMRPLDKSHSLTHSNRETFMRHKDTLIARIFAVSMCCCEPETTLACDKAFRCAEASRR